MWQVKLWKIYRILGDLISENPINLRTVCESLPNNAPYASYDYVIVIVTSKLYFPVDTRIVSGIPSKANMEQVEEERRQKEERNFQELLETIALDSAYFNSRDLQNKGKDVHPSAKQRKQVQDESAKIKFAVAAKRKQGNVVDDGMEFEEIDLKAKPRVFVMISAVNKYEPGEN